MQAPAAAAAEAKGQAEKSPWHKRQTSAPQGEAGTAAAKPPQKEAKHEEFALGESRRDMIVHELLTTERTYVEMLQIAVDQFLVPLRREDGAAVLAPD